MNSNGLYTPEQQIAALRASNADMRRRLLEMDHRILDADATRRAVARGYADECGQLQKLRDDAVGILNVLVEVGVVTRERLNAAIGV